MPESTLRRKFRDAEQFLARIRPWADRRWFYPVALLVMGVLTYLYALPALGYFWDDWEVVFLLNARNQQLFADYFAFDRPFAWPYQLMFAAFGLNPVAWHLVTLLLRWAGVLLLVYALLAIWPRYRSHLQWLGALLLVYPGYLQQSISGAYNRHFTAFFLFALSIFLMVTAARKGRAGWPYMLASWFTALVHVFTIEYFVGLELVRPVLLWLVLREPGDPRRAASVRKAGLLWLPYVLILVFYFWWRLVVFPSTIEIANYAGDFKLLQDFDVSILSGVFAILTRAVLDLLFATVRVWISVLGDPDAWTLQGKITWFAFGLGAALAAAFAFFHNGVDKSRTAATKPSRSLALFGLWAFFVSALPIWLTSKQLSTQGRWDDRFALAPMLGAVIVALYLIAAFIRTGAQRVLLSVLLALSIATQVLVVNRYRLEWGVQNSYYWQLHWRVPSLEPGTAIISFEQPSASIPGYDASFAVNMLFNGNPESGLVPYWFFTNDRFLNFELKPDRAISYKDRNLKFSGNTSDAIAVIHQGERRCLQVLDSVYADQPFYGQGQEQLVAVSNVARVRDYPATSSPDPQIFGAEPAHDWCYFFEKADLARQFADWATVLKLEKQAQEGGYSAGFGPELLPFIEAHAHQGDWQAALDLSERARGIVAEMDPLLCSIWKRLGQIPATNPAVVDSALQQFDCAAASH
ncbi:MAG TPA: hypothetical protein VIU38_11970 [Anaerolineales bacterium]